MTTKSSPDAKVKDNICECGASVANVNPGQPHDKSRQHLEWLDKVTTPDVVDTDLYIKRETLPEDMKNALNLWDGPEALKRERDQSKRMQKTAKAVRAIYAMEGWSDGLTPPDGIPGNVNLFLQTYSVPVLEDPRVIDRRRDALDPFRRV